MLDYKHHLVTTDLNFKLFYHNPFIIRFIINNVFEDLNVLFILTFYFF